MADGCKDLNQCLALATYDDLKEMIKNEMHLRHKIFTIGVMNTEYFSFETFKDDERQCDYCKTTCFLSAIKCNCKHDDGMLINFLFCLYNVYLLIFFYFLKNKR